jgi:hypothetical protein
VRTLSTGVDEAVAPVGVVDMAKTT